MHAGECVVPRLVSHRLFAVFTLDSRARFVTQDIFDFFDADEYLICDIPTV